MEALSYSVALDTLRERIDRAFQDHEPFSIDDKVVVMSVEDYRSLEETAYLLRSPANARRLLEAMEEIEAGGGVKRESPEWT